MPSRESSQITKIDDSFLTSTEKIDYFIDWTVGRKFLHQERRQVEGRNKSAPWEI